MRAVGELLLHEADMGAWGVVGFALLGTSRSASEGRVHMDDTTSDNLDQADEDILTYTASDEALEAAAGTLGGLLAQNNTVSAYWLGDCRLHPCAIGLLAGGTI
jgi:hypothetical protein